LAAQVETSRWGRGNVGDGAWCEIDEILDGYGPEGYEVESVQSESGEGGRWTTTRTITYEITEEGGDVAYFTLWRERPATEMQDGMDFAYTLTEVEPREVVVVEYVRKKVAV
jgi:hypothetical protein